MFRPTLHVMNLHSLELCTGSCNAGAWLFYYSDVICYISGIYMPHN